MAGGVCAAAASQAAPMCICVQPGQTQAVLSSCTLAYHFISRSTAASSHLLPRPQTVRDKCFKMCIASPGSSLSSSDQKCINRCVDRYQDVSAE